MLVLADHGVAFPVSKDLSTLNFCWALRDMALARHDASAIWAAVPFAKALAHASGETKQRATGFHIAPDIPVNGLVADFKVVVYLEAAADLFGAPALSNHQPDMVPVN